MNVTREVILDLLPVYVSGEASPATKALIEAILAEGIAGATLLDIGGGIGAIAFELLEAGAASARTDRPPCHESRRISSNNSSGCSISALSSSKGLMR